MQAYKMAVFVWLVIYVGISSANQDMVLNDTDGLVDSIPKAHQVNIEDLLRNLICGCYGNSKQENKGNQVDVPFGEIDPLNPKPRVTDCYDILLLGQTSSGVYDIHPFNEDTAIRVWCDMDTDGGGWTVFQRREDGSIDFYRDWLDYKSGFGLVGAEFWIGNDQIYNITNQGRYELRIDMDDFEGEHRFAKYDHFRVGDPSTNYKLFLGNYSGNAGDGFNASQRNTAFSTKDNDNDETSVECAQQRKGGFWFGDCGHVNLNGEYLGGVIPDNLPLYQGIRWRDWKGDRYSLKRTEMKMRPYRVHN